MGSKTFIWLGVLVFGTIGGYIPVLWGAPSISFGSIIGSTIGGLVGIYVGFKVGRWL